MVALWAPWHTEPEPARVAFELQTAAAPARSRMFAISPDGTHLVARVADGDIDRLWVRPLARLEGATLARTDGASTRSGRLTATPSVSLRTAS